MTLDDIRDLRHVSPDRDFTHLVDATDDDQTLCGEPTGILRVFGDAPETLEEAATAGAWVAHRDDICPDCRDVVLDFLFDQGDA